MKKSHLIFYSIFYPKVLFFNLKIEIIEDKITFLEKNFLKN